MFNFIPFFFLFTLYAKIFNSEFHGFLKIQMYIKIAQKKEFSCYDLPNLSGSKPTDIQLSSAQCSGLRHYPRLLFKSRKRNVT